MKKETLKSIQDAQINVEGKLPKPITLGDYVHMGVIWGDKF